MTTAEPASAVVLEVDDLVKHYPVGGNTVTGRTTDSVKAVDGVSFQLGHRETLGIVGESGCGKSTLAKLLVRLERPTSGSVRFRGQDLASLRGKALRDMRRHIQIVFQDPYTSLNPRMTVEAIVDEAFVIHPEVAPRKHRRRRVLELLDRVGLSPDHADRYPHQFSGGQRQRIGIARGLALQPEVLVLDEPVSALDVSVQAQVVNLLADLQDDLGLSYIFIAHDLSVIRQVCQRVGVMYLGRLAEIGTAAEVYDRSTHPYTQALLSAAPIPDPAQRDRPGRILLAGDVPSPVHPPSGCRFRTRCWKATELCAEQEPALILRPGSAHPSACHYPSELAVVGAGSDR